VLTVPTTKFNIQKIYILSSGCICVFYGYQNKERLTVKKIVWLFFVTEKGCVNGAAAEERLYKIQINLPPQSIEQTENFRSFAPSPIRPFNFYIFWILEEILKSYIWGLNLSNELNFIEYFF